MKKKTIIIASAIYLFLAIIYSIAVFFYINKTLLPKKIKPFLAQLVQNATGKKTTIEAISFSLAKGIALDNLVINDAIGNRPLKFSKVYIKINYIPLLLEKKLIYSLSTSPAEGLMFRIKSQGTFGLKDKVLEAKVNIRDFPLAATGELIKIKRLKINEGKSDISAEIKIDSLKNTKITAQIPFKDLAAYIFNNSFSGDGTVDLTLSKKADSAEADYVGVLTIKKMEAEISEPIADKVSLSEGKIQFDRKNVEISSLKLKYLNTIYSLSGNIANFVQPKAYFTLSAPNTDAYINLTYAENELYINKATLKLPDSSLEIQGSIKDLHNPELNVYLTGNLNTRDLKLLPFKFVPAIEKAGLDSKIEAELYAKGALKDWQNINGLLKLKSESFTIKKFNFKDLSLNIQASEGKANLKMDAGVYGGRLQAFMNDIGLKGKFPFTSRIIIEELDLKKLNDTYKTQKEISGYFNAEANISGNLKTIQDTTGTGWMEITQGRLFELPLFKGLLGIINVPGAEKNVFREAHCDFAVKNRAVTTENLEFISQRLTINGAGSIYLDGKLDMRIRYSLPEQKEETSGLDRLQDLLLKGTSSFVKEVALGGTLKKPEYRIIPVSIDNLLQNILK